MILLAGFTAWIAGVLVIEKTGKDELGSATIVTGAVLIIIGAIATLIGAA